MYKKHLVVLCVSAFFSLTFLSCTENDLNENEQNIEPDKVEIPTNG